jgi:hypothetical protein
MSEQWCPLARFRSESLWAKQERTRREAEQDERERLQRQRKILRDADSQVARVWAQSVTGASQRRTETIDAAAVAQEMALLEAEVHTYAAGASFSVCTPESPRFCHAPEGREARCARLGARSWLHAEALENLEEACCAL